MRRQVSVVLAATITIAACGGGTPTAAVPAGGAASTASPGVSPSSSAGATVSTSAGPTLDAKLTFTLVAAHDSTDVPGLSGAGYISFGPDGNLYVPSGSEILVLAADTKIVRRWGSPGPGPGELDFVRVPGDPTSAIGGVAFGADGSAYVVEAGNKRVQRFDAAGRSELTWGERGEGDGQFIDPIGIAVSPRGQVYVVDDERDDIQVFSADGDYLRTIGRRGSDPGELQFTGNIRIRADGLLVNADFGNARIQAWDTEDAFAWKLGSGGTGLGQFVEPQDVAFGPDETLFVVDDARVQAFGPDGQVIGLWPEQPSADHLASIAFNGESLWVLAPYGNTLFEIRVASKD